MTLNRRQTLAAAASFALATGQARAQTPAIPAWSWRHYASTLAASKYAPLHQIDATNVARLKLNWTWDSLDKPQFDADPAMRAEMQATPISVGSLLVVSTAMSRVAAVDPTTGQTVWAFDPEAWKRPANTVKGPQTRGVAQWGEGRDTRVIAASGDGRLFALDARTGSLINSFGEGGFVDLRRVGAERPIPDDRGIFGITSAPVVVRDIIIVGSSIADRAEGRTMPRGDVRAFDAHTGRLKWVFHTIPRRGEFGYDTWLNGSAETAGNTNVWAPMSGDEALGLVFLPVSTPTDNFYGGNRPGNGLFGDSLVAIDIETGQRRWHYQIVRHGVWDYDLPAAPVLADVTIGGVLRKIVAQVTKHGYVFVFDRETGAPIWPIEDRPAPQSKLPNERTSPTQPHPTRPAAFERQGISEDDLINFTPELRAAAIDIVNGYEHGPLFTPPSMRPTVMLPSYIGGANWNGAALDPETGFLFVPSTTLPLLMALDESGTMNVGGGAGDGEVAGPRVFARGPEGLPLVKPPYGRITCIDLKTGDHVWQKANGRGMARSPRFARYHPEAAGSFGRAQVLASKTLLFAGEGPQDPITAEKKLHAYDKRTGDVVASVDVPDFVLGAPMTFMAQDRQFIVYAGGYKTWPHALYALALDD